ITRGRPRESERHACFSSSFQNDRLSREVNPSVYDLVTRKVNYRFEFKYGTESATDRNSLEQQDRISRGIVSRRTPRHLLFEWQVRYREDRSRSLGSASKRRRA